MTQPRYRTTMTYIIKTPKGARLVAIRDGHVTISYLPASMWSRV